MKMRIRTRLLLFNVAVIVATSTLLAVTVYALASHQIREETKGFLADEFHEYAHKYSLLLDDLPALNSEMRLHFTKARMTYPIFCRIYDSNAAATVHVANASSPPPTDGAIVRQALAGRESVGYSLGADSDGREFWSAIKPVRSPSGKLFVFELGLDVHRLQRRIQRLRNHLMLAVPAVLLISMAGGWWVTRNSLRPVGQLLDKLQMIRTTSLHERLPVRNTADEFDSLAEAVNTMLEDIEAGFSLAKEFTADAAHELRTPLTKLTIMLEDSLNRSLTPDQAQEALDDAYEQCARLRQLVDDLMLLARLDTGELEGEPVCCDLSETVSDLEELWSAACEERGIELTVSALAPLPVRGRGVLLRRVLANLMDNALRHTPRGGAISVTSELSDEQITICVTNSGPGIADDEILKIFNRFYRVDSARSAEAGGTGLGLNICQKIVQLHNGRIEARSQPQGVVFSVSLPRDHQT